MEIEDGGAANIEGESSDVTHHFTSTGLVPIILGAPRNELGDDIPVQFIRHVPQKIADGNAGLTRTPSIDHSVRVIIRHLLLESV